MSITRYSVTVPITIEDVLNALQRIVIDSELNARDWSRHDLAILERAAVKLRNTLVDAEQEAR